MPWDKHMRNILRLERFNADVELEFLEQES